MFRVGQKCICVDDSVGAVDWYLRPTLGAVYTVVGRANNGGIYLAELPNGTIGRGWRVTRFRPIISRPTSIAVFEEILRKVNAPGRVTA